MAMNDAKETLASIAATVREHAPRLETPLALASSIKDCPRCAYDLRVQLEPLLREGEGAAWPLAITCSECGLVMATPDLVLPERALPVWYVEFAQAGVSRRARWLGTFARALLVGSVWSRMPGPMGGVRLEHEVRLSRLVWWCVGCLVLVALVLGAPAAISILSVTLSGTPTGTMGATPVTLYDLAVPATQWAMPLLRVLHATSILGTTPLWKVNNTAFVDAWWCFVCLWWVCTPLGFLVAWRTRKIERVRAAHVFRVWAWSLPLLCVPAVWFALACASRVFIFSAWGGGPWGGGGSMRSLLDFFLSYVYLVSPFAGAVLLAHWMLASDGYLRLRQGWWSGFVLVVLGGVVAGAITLVLPGLDALDMLASWSLGW